MEEVDRIPYEWMNKTSLFNSSPIQFEGDGGKMVVKTSRLEKKKKNSHTADASARTLARLGSSRMQRFAG